MLTNTICFINQKGGCGKSSSCFHLAGHFATRGLRVLVIDADPQGSLSQGFFGSAAIEQLPSRETLAAVFTEDEIASPERLIMPTQFERISVVRANAQLAKHNVPEPENTGMKQFALASFLETVLGFDLILMDCPPNLYLCSWNAMLASNFVVIPVPPEDFATQGLRTVHQAIEQAKLLQPALTLLGISSFEPTFACWSTAPTKSSSVSFTARPFFRPSCRRRRRSRSPCRVASP
jgi:chromosome partitioning protein